MPVTLLATDAEVDQFLVEQLEALTDELWSRRVTRGGEGKAWDPAQCPWCRRLGEIGMPELDCPLCVQVARSEAVVEGRSGGHSQTRFR